MSGRTDTLRSIESEVGALVRRVKRAIGERARWVHPELQPLGYLILAHLVHRGPVRASVLVEQLAADKGAMSRHVQHLVDLGLVERRPDPDDGRALLLVATPDGQHRFGEVDAARRATFDRRFDDWTDDDLTTLAGLLRRYNASVEGVSERP